VGIFYIFVKKSQKRSYMKELLFATFLSVISIQTFAQINKNVKPNINARVETIFRNRSVSCESIEPIMNSDMKKNYRIKFHNGSKKRVIAIKLTLNFNVFYQPGKRESKDDCVISKNVKIVLKSQETKTSILYRPDKDISCHSTPSVIINTIVFSDGTFEDKNQGISSFLEDQDKKEAIKAELLKQQIKN
jgi:hypothetical protein